MDCNNTMIALKDEPRDNIASCTYDKAKQLYNIIFQKNNTTYNYGIDKVRILNNSENVNTTQYAFIYKGNPILVLPRRLYLRCSFWFCK